MSDTIAPFPYLSTNAPGRRAWWLVGCVLACLPRSGAAADPPPTLPADAEVHGVGVYQPRTAKFDLKEVADWPGLGAKLQAAGAKKAGGFAQRVWDALPDSARRVLADADRSGNLTTYPRRVSANEAKSILADRRAVADGFLTVIDNPKLYAAGDFKGMDLGEDANAIIGQGDHRTKLGTRRLNRRLFRATFPDEFWQTEDPSSVVVEVKAGRPVVLVLTANESCRWVVRAEKGARVPWVVLSGYHEQEVTGVDCPVRVIGRKVAGGDEYSGAIHVYDQTSERYPAYEDTVAAITGTKLSTFQGSNTYSGKPFVVRPGPR